MFMNTGLPPFDDVAFGERSITQWTGRSRRPAGGAEIARPTCQLLPPGFAGYRPSCPYTLHPNAAGTWSSPDWARARRLVRESRTSGSRVRIWVNRSEKQVGRYFASLLQRLGYRSSLRLFSVPAYWTAIADPTGPVNLWWVGWVTDYLASSSFIQPLFGCDAFGPRSELRDDFVPWCDPAADALMRRALTRQSSDPTAANLLWESVDRRLTGAAAAVPLFNRRRVALVSDRVENVQHHQLWGVLTDQLWVR